MNPVTPSYIKDQIAKGKKYPLVQHTETELV